MCFGNLYKIDWGWYLVYYLVLFQNHLKKEALFWSNYSDLTRPHPKRWFSKGNPLISGKPRLLKYYNFARLLGGGFEICFWNVQTPAPVILGPTLLRRQCILVKKNHRGWGLTVCIYLYIHIFIFIWCVTPTYVNIDRKYMCIFIYIYIL